MSQVIGPIGSYDNSRVIEGIIGATAVRPGDLLKFDTALLVPLADNDHQIQVYVALGYGAVGAKLSAVPLQDIVVRIKYTGSAPTIGLTYGVSDQRTLDQADTSNKLLTVVKVGTGGGLDSGFVSAIMYGLAS